MMELLIIFLPFLAFIFIITHLSILSIRIAAFISVGSVGFSAIFSIICAFNYLSNGITIFLNIGKWFPLGIGNVEFLFLFDALTFVMLCVVTFISFLVHIYSLDYMSNDPELPLFLSYLSLFTFFMLILVTSGNFILMFMGWEGVGLSSYLLINFWHTRIAANKAAIKAVVINKIGDVFLMVSMAFFFYTFHTLDYSTMFAVAPFIKPIYPFLFSSITLFDFACLFLLCGAVAKSAQLGLHTWLPDAMEGPSPVSALIHAATMVTAGIFLFVRCSPLLEFSNLTLTIATFLGSLTAFFAATTALCQNDIKRVIAYSTCSQLGYMLFACGCSGYDFAMFHLFNHAFFKALLFLSAGSVIHALSDEQDLRKMGGLLNLLPLSYVSILFGSLSLMGLPFLTGFYSKEGILEIAYTSYNSIGYFSYILGILAAFFTSLYSIRLIILTFLQKPNAFRESLKQVHDAPYYMATAMIILYVATISIGFFAYDIFVGTGTNFWSNSLFIHPQHFKNDIEFIAFDIKLIPVILSFLACVLGFYFYYLKPNFLSSFFSKPVRSIYFFLNYKWFFDPIFNFFIARLALFLGHRVTFEILDRGFFELLGPLGLAKILKSCITSTHNLHVGYLPHYIAYILMGLSFIVSSYYFDFNPKTIHALLISIICYIFIRKYLFKNKNG